MPACGGGGGGSGGGSSPTPPPPPPPSGQGLVLPSSLQGSRIENLQNGFIERFDFNVSGATTSLSPNNFRLEGADAVSFEVLTIIAGTGSDSVFRATLDLSHTAPFDFEMPTDANGDNVYSFDYAFSYGQTTYRVPIEVTIINDLEGTTISGSIVRFDDFEPSSATKIPDVSGDGLPDVALVQDRNLTSSKVFILESETIAASEGIFNVIENNELFSEITSTARGTERLTIKDAADGQGLDILYSDTSRGRFTYFDADTPADWAFLRGVVDVNDTANNPISYTSGGANDEFDAQLIHDVDQDGNNDIFIFGIRNGEIGIRFGAARNGPGDTSRSSVADISFSNNDLVGVRPSRRYQVEPFPDTDGDGQPELMLILPQYSADGFSNDEEGAIWIVNSTRFFTASSTINLDDANEPGVRRIVGDPDTLVGESVIETTDGNGDPFFLIGYGDRRLSGAVPTGVAGISLANLQALPQRAGLSDLLASSVNYIRGPDAQNSPVDDTVGPLFQVGDLDGDGEDDFISQSSMLIMKADILAGATIIGEDYAIPNENAPRIDIGGIIVDFSEQGFIGFVVANDFGLVRISDIQQALMNPDGEITVDRPF
ncbi:MAG: hypothetical protein AAGH90_01635 [Pseudomonadota bacterium]